MRLMFPFYLNNLLWRFYSLRPPSFPECPSPPSQLLMAQSCVEAFVPVCSWEHRAAGVLKVVRLIWRQHLKLVAVAETILEEHHRAGRGHQRQAVPYGSHPLMVTVVTR
ncbi:hypothetical protein AMECASPLE_011954 [Ameca splendens]|uniref:Secreted protein n=1 Tax=Ameca splendens TaxID=208324 RepID=A0ABV0YZF6_9TELE